MFCDAVKESVPTPIPPANKHTLLEVYVHSHKFRFQKHWIIYLQNPNYEEWNVAHRFMQPVKPKQVINFRSSPGHLSCFVCQHFTSCPPHHYLQRRHPSKGSSIYERPGPAGFDHTQTNSSINCQNAPTLLGFRGVYMILKEL